MAQTAQVINFNRFPMTVESLRKVRSLRNEVANRPQSEKKPTDPEAIAALDTCIAQLSQLIAEPLSAI